MKQYNFIIFSIVVCLISICCGTKGKECDSPLIKEVDGIVHVVNPAGLQNPPRQFYLKEELSIGNEDGRDFVLGVMRDMDVDGDGNIYMLDGRQCCVRVFSPEGRYLRAIGKKGQGPGEILFPLEIISSGTDGMIHVLDYRNNKISRYHPDGELDADLKLKEGIAEQLFMMARSYFVINWFYDEQGFQKYKVVKYSYEGKLLLQSDEFLSTRERVIKKGNSIKVGSTPFSAERYFAHDSMNRIFTGLSDQYEISIFDPDFNLVKVIQKRNPAQIRVTREEIDNYLDYYKERHKKKGVPISDEFLKLIQFPRYHPLFKGIWMDSRNRLLVRTPSEDGKAHIDVFSTDGIYIDKMLIGEIPGDISMDQVFRTGTIFRGDYIYTRTRDVNDECEFKKYRITDKS